MFTSHHNAANLDFISYGATKVSDGFKVGKPLEINLRWVNNSEHTVILKVMIKFHIKNSKS